MIKVRDAIESDLPYMLEQAKEFYDYYPVPIKYDPAHMANLLLDMMESGIVLVAEEDGQVLGGIGGIMGGNIYDPTYITLTEMYLWVAKASRKGRAMHHLIKEFTKRGEVADAVVLCYTKLTPSLGRIYERYGYELMETSHVKES